MRISCFVLEKPKWAAWGTWEECSVTCGVGSQVRKRDCKNPASEEGCTGERLQIQACLKEPCPGNGKFNYFFFCFLISFPYPISDINYRTGIIHVFKLETSSGTKAVFVFQFQCAAERKVCMFY